MLLSTVLPILVVGVGGYLLVKLRFFFILQPKKCARELLLSMKDKENRRSLSLALAGTLGVGNIFGVAAGILIGGAGCVFWLVVSSLFAMVIKYSECILTFDAIKGEKGGMHLVLLKVFEKWGGILSILYTVVCVFLSFFMGGAMQSRAAIDIVYQNGGISPWIIGFGFGFFVIIGVIGGTGKIEKITEKLVPIATIIYILIAFLSILKNISSVGNVVVNIMSNAFNIKSVGGGLFSFLSSKALTEGFARGILSNEAGTGTSSFAHSRGQGRTSHTAGLSGICEVFFDTVLLCPMTAFAILTAVPEYYLCKTPMSLIYSAITRSIGNFYGLILTITILIFAYSTVICWFYYGGECIEFLFGKKYLLSYSLIFLSFVIFSPYISTSFLLGVTDILLLILAFLTLSAVLKRRDRICLLAKVCEK